MVQSLSSQLQFNLIIPSHTIWLLSSQPYRSTNFFCIINHYLLRLIPRSFNTTASLHFTILHSRALSCSVLYYCSFNFTLLILQSYSPSFSFLSKSSNKFTLHTNDLRSHVPFLSLSSHQLTSPYQHGIYHTHNFHFISTSSYLIACMYILVCKISITNAQTPFATEVYHSAFILIFFEAPVTFSQPIYVLLVLYFNYPFHLVSIQKFKILSSSVFFHSS